jgi:hypothetical protein
MTADQVFGEFWAILKPWNEKQNTEGWYKYIYIEREREKNTVSEYCSGFIVYKIYHMMHLAPLWHITYTIYI